MGKFDMMPQSGENNNKQETKENVDPSSFEALKKSVGKLKILSLLFLANFGIAEAQQKSECYSHQIQLTPEQAIEINNTKHAIDSLSDVLFQEASKHNLLTKYKEAPENHSEVDSSTHLYYKSRLADFGNKNAIVMYEKVQEKTTTIPANEKSIYEVDHKSICANGRLFVQQGSFFGISNYNDPSHIKEDKLTSGSKSALYIENDRRGNQITSNHGFTLVDFVQDAKKLQKSIEDEIALVRGMK